MRARGGAGDGPPDQLTVAPGLGVRGGDEIVYVDFKICLFGPKRTP